MNGKTAKAVHIVDRKAEKVKTVNKQVNRRFQKSEWSFVPPAYIAFIKALGKVFYIPVVLVMAAMEGIRAGFIAAAEKTLKLYR
jgi:hypothetical protein